MTSLNRSENGDPQRVFQTTTAAPLPGMQLRGTVKDWKGILHQACLFIPPFKAQNKTPHDDKILCIGMKTSSKRITNVALLHITHSKEDWINEHNISTHNTIQFHSKAIQVKTKKMLTHFKQGLQLFVYTLWPEREKWNAHKRRTVVTVWA